MNQFEQIQELQNMLDELSAEVAELSESQEAKSPDSNYVSSINAGLADLLALLRNRKDPEAPNITVNVSPTPIKFEPVVQVIDRPSNFRLTVTYDQYDRIKTADIVKINPS